MARYSLRSLDSARAAIRITETEFNAVVEAKAFLVGMLDIEQKFALLYENYADYERTLLEVTLNHALHLDHDWGSFQEESAEVTRHLSNLLSAARLYVDQVKHDLRLTLGREAARSFETLLHERYDGSLSFRLMEALRNVIQHRSLPFISVSHSGERIDGTEPRARFRSIARILVVDLGRGGLKRAVTQEIESTGRQAVALTPAVREYVGALGGLHQWLRKSAEPRVSSSQLVLANAQARVARRLKTPRNRPVLAVKMEEAGQVSESIEVFEDIGKRHSALLRRNRAVDGLVRRYVSSACDDDDAK